MKAYKTPISMAMAEYREDFRENKEWWTERMGTGRNNEYLWIQFKNGDNLTVQSDYFQIYGNTHLPNFRADEVAYISRYYGEDIEITTAADIEVATGSIKIYRDGVECFRCEMTKEEQKEMHRQIMELASGTNRTIWMLDYCRAFAASKMNNQADNQNNTPATMNTNEATIEQEYSHAAHCLYLYLMNTAEIYERYTTPAIARVVRAIAGRECVCADPEHFAKDVQEVSPAIQAAAKLVNKYDHMTPTAKDIEQATRSYAAYIVDCARFELSKA